MKRGRLHRGLRRFWGIHVRGKCTEPTDATALADAGLRKKRGDEAAWLDAEPLGAAIACRGPLLKGHAPCSSCDGDVGLAQALCAAEMCRRHRRRDISSPVKRLSDQVLLFAGRALHIWRDVGALA